MTELLTLLDYAHRHTNKLNNVTAPCAVQVVQAVQAVQAGGSGGPGLKQEITDRPPPAKSLLQPYLIPPFRKTGATFIRQEHFSRARAQAADELKAGVLGTNKE